MMVGGALLPSSAATLTDAAITEFLAKNQEGLTDEDGDSEDWIEIQNISGVSGDLDEWYLTDDPANLTKWSLPAVEIPNGGHLVIFASGKDRKTTPGELHANFSLGSSSGEYLALVKPNGTTIATEFVALPKQNPDVSYGEGFYLTPTPGATNGANIDGFVQDTQFSSKRGFYDAPISVAITTLTPGARIRYTTNGTTPGTTQGTIYSRPIAVSDTTVIRAIAYKAGFQSTNVDTHTYVFPESVVDQSRMRASVTQSGTYGPQMIDSLKSVPTISIVTNNALPFLSETSSNVRTEVTTSIEMIHPDGTKGFQEEGGLSNYGGRYTNYRKKSFRVAFRSDFGDTKLKYPIFDGFEYPNYQPAEEFDVINLRSGSHDMVSRGGYMSNRFTDDTMLEMGNVAPHGRFVHVYLNGNYWGQYHLRERWNARMAANYFGGSKDDYEAVNANNTGSNFYNGTFNGSHPDGDVYDGSGVEWNQTRSLVNGSNPFAKASGHIDVANAIDFMLLWVSGNSESEFRALGSPANGIPFKFFIKDADGFLRNPSHPVTHTGPINVMTKMKRDNDPDYGILLADRIHKHFFNDGALTVEKNRARLQKRVNEASLGFISEDARWGNHYRSVASWESYQRNLINNHFRNLTDNRITQFRNNNMYPDVNAPALSQHGGSIPENGGVTMTTNATAIYYTVDGSDPRFPGGAVSPTAIAATFSNDVREAEDFIEAGADWKYLDDGSDQGSNWRDIGFDDVAWESAPAQLGYGELSIQTTVGFIDTDAETRGNQKNATTYFRKNVAIVDPSDFSNFVVRIRYDDGAAVYVNGVEIARTATLPANASFDTFATSATPSESTYFDYPIPSSRFVDGSNTIAVEVHNQSAGSSDMRFDLVLRGEIDLSNGNNVTEPVMFDGPTELKARSFDSSANEWSALTTTFFTLDTVPADATNLVVSEIHYRPANPTSEAETAVSTDRDDYEFIELLNTTNQPIDLSGVYFDEGIDFHFADNTVIEGGSHIVLVTDFEAFTVRYGELGDGVVAGEYSGRLNNDGEQITLRKTGNATLLDLTYNDQDPWPALADGNGYSMIFTGTDPTDGAAWSTHSAIGGAPGEADTPLMLGYEEWKLVSGITDDQSDEDHDGLTAFAEYATGNDPAIPNHGSASTGGLVKIDTAGFLSVTYQRSLSAADVAFKVQESSDLQSWEDVPNPVLVNETTNEEKQTKRVTERLPDPVTPGSRKFLRVRMVR